MDTDNTKDVYKTRNSDLAAYLLFSDQELEGLVKEGNVVYMLFSDPIGKCRDLERVFLNSECKRYRDQHRWLLTNIHNCLSDSR